MNRVLLIFPPSWTYCTGSAHLSLPLLRSSLSSAGFRVDAWDLNWEFGDTHTSPIRAEDARNACLDGRLEEMNEPFFNAEDRLQQIAKAHRGQWNAQAGFESSIVSADSSISVLQAVDGDSPFRDWFRNVVLPRIEAIDPLLVGISISATQQLFPSMQLCHMLRNSGFRGFIALGGNTISRLWDELRNAQLFETVSGFFRFQGESAIVALAKALANGQAPQKVPGLLWCDHGIVIENSGLAPVNIQTAVSPDYEGLPVGQYWGANYLTLVAARGCYYGRCSFCAIPYGWGQGGYTGVRSPLLVLRDMKRLAQQHGIRRFKFVDEALSPKFLRELAELIIEAGAKFDWEGYTRFEPAWYQPEFVNLLARSGFRKGYFGLELLPSSGRSLLNKRDDAQPEKLLPSCSAAGIKVHFFCMVGFPGSGVAEAEETVRFLIDNADRIDTADLFPWTYAKHTVVPGVEPLIDPTRDWALEFEHASAPTVLSSHDVRKLADACEDIIWNEAPRLLHPTYRLVSPWRSCTAEPAQHKLDTARPNKPEAAEWV